VTLYELATLVPAVPAVIGRTAAADYREEPARPCQRNKRIPKDLETIILKAIVKESRSRLRDSPGVGGRPETILDNKPIVLAGLRQQNGPRMARGTGLGSGQPRC